jgi:prepilin-type N-terminal cleavage/methylation domain-containing protein
MHLTQTSASQPVNRGQTAGFTLTELLVASAITSVVLAGSGLMTLLTADQAAEQRQNRRQELNRALAFIADDIRAAQAINLNAAKQTVTANVALADAANRFPTEIPYRNSIEGTEVLYLEIPIPPLPPPKPGEIRCSAPEFDRVTYEISPKRTSFFTATSPLGDKLWRGPYLLYRHGRIPGLDGRINPCSERDPSKPSEPQNEVLVDGLLNPNASPPPLCGTDSLPKPALSGIAGFYTCVTGGQVALMLRGDASPRPWERGNDNPSLADVTPVTLTSMVFQRGNGPEASPSPGGSPSPPPMCHVPNLLGRTQTNAKLLVSSYRLKYNAVADPILATPRDQVASQVPTPDSKLPCNHIVMFTYKP